MDPVSHVVLGYSCTTTRARQSEPPVRGRVLAVVLGSLAPDIDVAFMATGWDRYLAVHEIGTHSAIGAAVCGALAAALASVIRRGCSYRLLAVPAVIAALSHVAADLLAGASIRLVWPFLDQRVENLGVVAMAEPLFVAAAVLVGVTLLATSRRRRGRAHFAVAMTALLALAALIAVQTDRRERAEEAYRRHPASADAIGPYLVEAVWRSTTTWRVLDRTAASVRAWAIDSDLDVSMMFEIPLVSGDATLVAASTTWDTVENFRKAHDLAFAVATDKGVEWSDVRYCSANTEGRPQCSVWAGGEFSSPPQLGRLVVRVGDLLQTR